MGKKSLKILQIDTEKGWRGGQQQVLYLHRGLLESGYDSVLICQPGSDLEMRCRDKSFPVIPVKMRNEFDILAGRKIAAIAKDTGADIAHLHSAHALAIGLWVKLFHKRIKLIAVRRVDFHIRKNILSRLKYKNKRLDQIVCISEGIKKILVSDGIPEPHLVTIYSGTDLEKFKNSSGSSNIRREFNIPSDSLIVGTVAALVGHKDYPTLIKAAGTVTENFDRVTFLAVGEGTMRAEISRMVSEFGLSDKFILTGFRQDVGELLKSFDVFVLSSKEEGLGTSLLDAQALGLPVVGTDAGGIPEAIEDGVNGLLVPKENPQKLAEAILKLLRDEKLRSDLGAKAKESVKKFSIEKTIEKTIELYKNLCK